MKKILSILLAICLMVGMVSVLASAEEATPKRAAYRLPIASATAATGGVQTEYIVNEDADAVYYYTTDSNGFAVENATEANYNIKVTFKPGEPLTMYLKAANINVPRDMGAGSNSALYFGKISQSVSNTIQDFDVLIVVEADSSVKNSWGKYDGTTVGTSHGNVTISAALSSGHSLTFTGPGKLDVWSDCITPIGSSSADIIIKDITLNAELEISAGCEWGDFTTISTTDGDLTIDNAKVNLKNNYRGNVEAKNITIKNGSDVNIYTDCDLESRINLKATESYTLDNSDLLVDSIGSHAVNNSPFTMVGVNALGGIEGRTPKEFSNKKQVQYWYLLAGPNVEIPTEPETTAPAETNKPGNNTTKPNTAASDPAGSGAATKPAGSGAATKPAGSAGATKPAGNATGNAASDATTGDNTTTPVDNNTNGNEKKGGLTWLYILLGVVILAGVAVVVLVLVKRNAAAAEEEVLEEGEEAEEADAEAEEAEAEEAEAEEAEAEVEETEEPETTEDAE